MSWSYQTSLSRVETHLQGMGEIEVEKLVRDADLHNLLSETCCRNIYGAHVYLDIPNFADLATMTAEGAWTSSGSCSSMNWPNGCRAGWPSFFISVSESSNQM